MKSLIKFVGTMTSSDVQVLSISKGTPLCRMSVNSYGKKYNCLLVGHNALQALYEVQQHDTLLIVGKMNNHKQLVVSNYRILRSTYSQPKNFA